MCGATSQQTQIANSQQDFMKQLDSAFSSELWQSVRHLQEPDAIANPYA